MSVFSSIEDHDKEFEYKLMRERFVSCGGPDRKGNWTIIEIRPRPEYEKEYEGQKLVSFEYLMSIIKSKWPGYENLPEEALEEVVKSELHEHNINVINYPMRLTDMDGECTGYKDILFYVIPYGMIDHIGDELFKWVIYAINLDISRTKDYKRI